MEPEEISLEGLGLLPGFEPVPETEMGPLIDPDTESADPMQPFPEATLEPLV